MLDNASKNKPNGTQSSQNKSKEQAGAQGAGAAGKQLPLKGSYGPADTESVDVFRLLDQLEELPEKAKHVPLINGLVGFDHEQFYYLVLKIRANLPDDLKKAHRVVREFERIADEARDAATHQLEYGRAEANKLLEDAKVEGARLVEQSRRQAAVLVDSSEVKRMATDQAHGILRSAETEAAEIRKGADDYARDVLSNLEAVMQKAISTVQRGRETLDKARG